MSGSTTFLTNTYSVYKAYTSEVCQWLFTAAGVPIEAGRSSPHPEVASNPPASRPQGRPKGKARKLAKAQGPAASAPQNPPQSVPDAQISVSQLVDLARQLASIPDKVSNVPRTILSKLKKAIQLRRQYLALYSVRPSDSKPSDADLGAKNQSHAHFVHALESVLRILEPSQPNQTQAHSTESPTASAASPSQRDNRFNVLDVENMDDDQDDASQTTAGPVPNHSNAPSSGTAQPKADLVDETDVDDLMFRIFCLFTDMHRLKAVLRDHWEQYKAGSVSLETVALMTELSITAIRNAEKDLIAFIDGPEILPKELGYTELGMALFKQLSIARLGDSSSDGSLRRDQYHPAVADIVELTFFSIYTILNALPAVVKPNQIPWSIPGQMGVYNRNADRSKMTVKEIELNDRIILIELFSDFCTLEHTNASDEFEDQLTKGIRKLYNPNSPTIPVWLVFASDCFLVTHEILGDDIARPFEELTKAALHADDSLTRFFQLRQGQPSFELWPDSNTQSLRNFQNQFIRSSILGDRVRNLKLACSKIAGRDIRDLIDVGPPNNFLKSHPILSGLLLLRLRILFQDAGCTIAGVWGTVLYTSHAYNAFRQSGSLDVVWPEMEWFISHYTPQKLFAGFLPKTPEQCFKSFNLLMGTSLSHFAPNSRRTRTPRRIRQSVQGPRDWATKSAALEILTDWAQNDDPARRPDPSGRLLARLMALNQPSVCPGQLRVVGIPGQILAFKVMMEDEMFCLKRDFVDLHLRCVELLRALRSGLDIYFTQLVGQEYIENENQLCMMVGWILLINSNNQKSLEKVYKNRLSPNIRSVSIEIGARVMKQFILANPTFEV